MRRFVALAATVAAAASLAEPAPQSSEAAPGSDRLELRDVFDLEYASDPRLAPDGKRVAYVRRSGDVMTDRYESSLWLVDADGGNHRQLLPRHGDVSSPRWSPSGDAILFAWSAGGAHELRALHLPSGAVSTIAELRRPPSALAWSPSGDRVAFRMFALGEPPETVPMPAKPEGAQWADPPTVVDELRYRFDGAGYLTPGHDHLFVVPADAGTPRQITFGAMDQSGPIAWSPDGSAIYFSGNTDPDREFDPIESNIYRLDVASGELERLTDRDGPDVGLALSPDGRRLAYLGFDDRRQGYQTEQLYVMDLGSGETRSISSSLDRSVSIPAWSPDGRHLFATYDDEGVTRLARFNLAGAHRTLAENIGGATLGRPYPSASFTVGPGGRVATIVTSVERPADLALLDPRAGEDPRILTRLNEDVLAGKDLAGAREVWVESSADAERIHAWVMYPPGFDPSKKHPLILEIHGGPFANYGPRFSAEMQLFAARGYVVVYANPRGSTSYGERFGNLIHHAYPGRDYDDLMSVVDRVIELGGVDEDRLFVTGGSGGGVLTAWIVGQTDRFRAAVVAKPVINWTSFVLTADAYPFFTRYWFPAQPWEDPMHYWERSPLSLVGNVTTPTMLLTGEEDWRTPISESEQYYQALKLARAPTRMVRIPGASHGIASRPSRLAAKVSAILQWFELHDETSRGE